MLGTILIIALAVVLNVFLHLGVLLFLYKFVLPRLKRFNRFVVGGMVAVAIFGHMAEIGVFTGAMALVASLAPNPPANGDVFFWSATAYTSLGSDYPPVPEVRLLAAVEALTGLILITWTASFLFLIMQQYWQEKKVEQ